VSINITWDTPLPPEHAAALGDASLVAAVQAGGAPGERARQGGGRVFLVDPKLTELHGRFLNDPTPTDVISFDLLGDEPPSPEDPGPDAELYISVDCALRVSAERGVSLARELCLYAVHGALHLCGFDDHEPDERAAMRLAERHVLHELGFEEDQGPHD
jgi:probable rRNA maturation factor